MREIARLAVPAAVIVVAAWTFMPLDQKHPGLKKGDLAPTFRLPALDGGTVDLAAFRGKVVVVNFWATWCPPCVQEMPSLEKLHRTLGPDGLVVLGVSVDEDEAAVRSLVQKVGITFPTLRDPGGRGPSAAYQTTGYPETFVIDPQGLLLDKYIGPSEWATPAAIEYFREVLRRPDAPASS